MNYGAIADDFTGATDLAGNWRARGLRTSVLLGTQHPDYPDVLRDDDAVVVALKTRSVPAADAVRQSLAAAHLLRELGCEQLYDKYCSTFDSTPEGNIGPVADALLQMTGAGHAVVVPSFPDNGRTVYQGHLFVGSQPLHESPMRDHPLNPMRDSDVRRLLVPQTRHEVGLVPHEVVRQGATAVRAALTRCEAEGQRLVVVDAVSNDDLVTVARATHGAPLVTGGSGLALGAEAGSTHAERVTATRGEKVVLSGSASAATRVQVKHAKDRMPDLKLDLARLLEDRQAEIERMVAWAAARWAEAPGRPVLIYSVGSADDVVRHEGTKAQSAEVVETVLAELADRLSDVGAAQFIVAGGETSGAVLERLGVRRLRVGQLLSPGVSWLAGRTRAGREHNFVLKSGNFGTTDLFVNGWGELS